MNQNDVNYRLDFLLPKGPTGPKGVMGATGPTGPASLSDLIFLEFNSTSNEGDLEINKNIILPNNSNIFVPKSNEIEISEPGNYEITISGILGGLTSNELLSMSMIVTSENGASYSVMLASIIANSSQEYFSQTMLFTFPQKQTIKIFFRKDGFYNSAAESVSLLIKKLNF